MAHAHTAMLKGLVIIMSTGTAQSLDPSLLPSCVKVGLPPAMTHDFTQAYWGQDYTHPDHINKDGAHLVGFPSNSVDARGAIAENRIVDTAMASLSQTQSKVCARQVFGHLKGITTPPIMPLPWDCSRAAPADINVYTDGSWQFPLRPMFGLGGAGVWWPNRNLVDHRANEAECDLAQVEQTDDGVLLYTHRWLLWEFY